MQALSRKPLRRPELATAVKMFSLRAATAAAEAEKATLKAEKATAEARWAAAEAEKEALRLAFECKALRVKVLKAEGTLSLRTAIGELVSCVKVLRWWS